MGNRVRCSSRSIYEFPGETGQKEILKEIIVEYFYNSGKGKYMGKYKSQYYGLLTLWLEKQMHKTRIINLLMSIWCVKV